MHAWILQINGLAAAWLESLGRACCQGGAALLAVWIIGRVVPKLAPQAKLWLWRLAYLKLLAAFLWAVPLNLPVLAAKAPSRLTPAPARQDAQAPVPIHPAAKPARSVERQLPARPRPLPSAAGALLSAWLLGVGWFGVRLLNDLRQARRLRAGAQAPADQRVIRCCEELSARFGLRRPPSLRVSSAAAHPLLLGVWRPMILLPEALAAGASLEHLRLVVAHELAHLRRRDLWWVWPAVMGETLFFFHPVIWLAKREWRLAQEIACDDAAVRTTRTAAAHYGEMLVGVSAKLHAKARPPILATLGAVQTIETLKRRLNAMKLIANPSTKRSIIVASALLAAATLNVLPWRLVAQESGTGPAGQTGPEGVPGTQGVPGIQAEPGQGGQRAMMGRFGSGRSGGPGAFREMSSMRPGRSTPPPPTEVAPARFEATVYEVQVPEDRVAELDAQSLEAKAGTAQSLAKALAEFGHARILYKVDQTVNLFGESISLGTSQPMLTGVRTTDAGNSTSSVTYQRVGMILDISSTAPPPTAKGKGLDTQVVFQLAVLADSGVELSPKVKAPSIRNMELSHSETPHFGKPCVQLSVSVASGAANALPTAYVVRYVFSETKS